MAFYAITLVISIVNYRWYYDGILKNFPILIGYTLLTEILGYFIRTFDNFHIVDSELYPNTNNYIYNVWDIVFFLYFFWVFGKTIKNKRYKVFLKFGSILYIVVSLINPFFQNALIYPQLASITIGSIVLVSAILLYYMDLSNITTRNRPTNTLLFWVSVGLLLFYCFYPFINIAGILRYDLYQQWNVRTILHVLIVYMYSCFILGFILIDKKPLGK